MVLLSKQMKGTHLRKFGHLMPAQTFRVFRRPAVLRKGGAAGFRNHIDDEIDPFWENQSHMGAAVSGLSSGFAPRFLPLRMNALARSWSVGKWGLGGIGGVFMVGEVRKFDRRLFEGYLNCYQYP